MQRTLLFKILTIIGLIVLICVPLNMIEHMIQARSNFRAEAVESIAASSVREQTIVGPVLVIRYTDEYDERLPDAGQNGKAAVARSVQREHLVFPNDLLINGKINTFNRKRGIFNVLYYKGMHEMSGEFVLPAPAVLPRAVAASRITVTGARIAIGIDDVRGVQNTPKLNWNGTDINFRQGTGLKSLPSGLHADLAHISLDGSDKPVRFKFDLGVDGIEQQHIVPVGNNNRLTIASDWPHPAFGGQFLPMPDEQQSSSAGFSRTWNISNVSNDTQAQMVALERGPAPATGAARPRIDRVSIAFIEPVDVYTMAERATKYGLLFVLLTFAAFFLFEILKMLPIHPVQYLLVGLALALFFLLLLALSEHIAFWQAYLVASAGCIILISYYLSAVLNDWRRAAGFASALTALYGCLYGLLISENNALVLGSLLLFAILGAIMVATRKVDWYQIGRTAPGAA